jgi:hypothetical protein
MYGYCGGAAGLNGWDIGIDTVNHGGGQDFYIGVLENGDTTDVFYMNWPTGHLGIGAATPAGENYQLTVQAKANTSTGTLAIIQSANNTGDPFTIFESSGSPRLWVDDNYVLHTGGSGGGIGDGLTITGDPISQQIVTYSGTSHSYSWYIDNADDGQLRLRHTNTNSNVMEIYQYQGITFYDPVAFYGGFRDGEGIVLGTTNGTSIGTSASQKLSFYGATPVARPNTTGTIAGFTVSTGTTVVSGSTFTGNIGSTAYTIGDIVNALKRLGLLSS